MKTNNFGFRPDPIQIGLRKKVSEKKQKAWHFGYKNNIDSAIRVAKTKYVFVYAVCVFYGAAAHLRSVKTLMFLFSV